MKERRQIVEHWRAGAGATLVTLIRAHGSSYRQPGARLLTLRHGSYAGSVSAGCLEAALLRKASWLVRGGAVVERYSTALDDPAELPFGLGCGGVLDLLFEPVAPPECEALMLAMEASLAGAERMVATWLPRHGQPLLRAIFSAEGCQLFASPSLTRDMLHTAWGRCLRTSPGDGDELVVERLLAPQRLYVLGAGDDARPLVAMAITLGWNVTVVDGRAHLAQAGRFPGVAVHVADADSPIPRQITSADAVVIMTHSYEQDRVYLTAALPLRPRYLGLLGSRKRSALLIAEAAATLDWSLAECCEQVSAPVGLDIGGEGPEAIALSIVAEIQACCAGKSLGARRLPARYVEENSSFNERAGLMQTKCGTAPLPRNAMSNAGDA